MLGKKSIYIAIRFAHKKYVMQNNVLIKTNESIIFFEIMFIDFEIDEIKK